MLYDPKRWEFKVEVDPLSFEGLVKWLEQQPPTQTYRYTEPRHCLVAQWLQANGVIDYNIDSATIRSRYGTEVYNVANGGEETFGAALERARKLL